MTKSENVVSLQRCLILNKTTTITTINSNNKNQKEKWKQQTKTDLQKSKD